MGKKLMIGLLIDSYQIPHWSYRMIETITCSDYAEIVLIVKRDEAIFPNYNRYLNVSKKLETLLFSSYCKLDRFFNKLQPNAFELKNLQLLTPNVPEVVVRPIPQAGGEDFSEEDCGKIRAYKPDVLIALGFGSLSGEVLSIPQYGIWSYQHGDNGINYGGPAGFWEVLEGRGETGFILKILSEESEKEVVLSRSYGQTEKMSVCSYSNNSYWKTATFILRNLRELNLLGEKVFFARVRQENQHPFFYSKRNNTVPKLSALLGLIQRQLLKSAFRFVKKVFYFNQYILLFDFNSCGEFSTIFPNYKKLVPPYDRFWADPFVVYENHKYHVFIEEVTAQINRGHISCFTLDEAGNVSVPKVIIQKPYHMSYPFVFSHNNHYYMIPETSENRTIELYKCIEFPDKWELETTLIENIDAADATLFQRDGKWWLFASVSENEGTPSNDELFLFYSEDLFSGNWRPHLKNPIVSDVKSARPAGRIFTYNGSVYRPSQNSSKRYGYGIKINQIVTLSETDYKEECVDDIEPFWDEEIVAVHTLNFVNELTIIDGLRQRARRPSDILRYFRRRWGSNSG